MTAHDDAVQSKLACVVMLRGSDEATTVSGDGFKYYMLSLNANSEANSIGFYFDKNSNGGTQLRIYMPLGDGLRMERMVPIGKNIFVEQKLFFYYHIALFS
jgi:hypothetical protein